MGQQRRRRRREWTASSIAGLTLALVAAAFGCATPAAPPVPIPTDAERRDAEAAGFELPDVASARALLPPDVVTGPNYTVADAVYSDGSLRIYTIDSEFGSFEAHGDDMLRVRLHEVEALAALEDMNATKEFAEAAGRALASPFVATWNVISNPVDTILGVPKNVWEKIRRTGELARGDRGELEGNAFNELIGFEKKKRKVAAELGVDPYSSNKVLQRSLNRFAWAAYAGGLPSMFVPFSDAGNEAAGDPAADSGTARIDLILQRYSPEDLDRLNLIELAVMGTPPPLSEQFIHHPWFSPRHETAVVENLAALDLAQNRVAFIEAAINAESEADALFYQRIAELLRRYSDTVERIDRVVAIDGAVMGLCADGTLVVPLAADYAIWNPANAEFVENATESPPDIEIHRRRLLVSGTLSPRARAMTESRGVEVVENAFDEIPVAGKPESTGGG